MTLIVGNDVHAHGFEEPEEELDTSEEEVMGRYRQGVGT